MPGENLSPAQFGSRRLDGDSLNQSMQNNLELGDNHGAPLSFSTQTNSSAGVNTAWRKQGLIAHSAQTSGSLFRFGQ